MLGSDHVNALDTELHDVSTEIVRMLSLVRESLGYARAALVDAEPEAALACRDNDAAIDDAQDRIERTILSIIARRQPAARDLRFLGAMHRSLADVERAGDYAVHVANAGAELASEPPLKKYTDMTRILEVEDRMIDTTIAALAEGDEAKVAAIGDQPRGTAVFEDAIPNGGQRLDHRVPTPVAVASRINIQERGMVRHETDRHKPSLAPGTHPRCPKNETVLNRQDLYPTSA